MKKTIIKIHKMDCPSEIKLIEMAFENFDPLIKMDFNLDKKIVVFYHKNRQEKLLSTLDEISLHGEIFSSEVIKDSDVPDLKPSMEASTLKYLLIINFFMFLVEVMVGYYAESTGLIADGLDMFADSMVYSLSLYAVGKSIGVKNRAAYLSGIMQISLGLLCILEVGRKFYFGSNPLSSYMILISIIALLANIWCLVLIHKHKDGEVHMRASWIFSANDVIVNTGVLASGILVYFFKSNLPDLIIGGLVSLIVIVGGITIIKISKREKSLEIGSKSCCSNDFINK